jgi:DNA-binding Lrp family transcriptional regulator
MLTKPQDIVVALKITLGDGFGSYSELGHALGMSASEVHAGVRRLVEARLLDPETKRVRGEALRNFLVHGVPYAFPASPKEVTRGMPTAWAAPAMAGKFSTSDQLPPVWPDPNGKVQGVAVQPLYPSVPGAAGRDPALYDLLALVDALRIGRARERGIAEKEITESLCAHVTA